MADVDEKDVDVIEEVNEDKYGPRVAQILSKFGSIPNDLNSYVGSVCGELGEGDNTLAEWETALSHVLLPVLPNKEALPGVLQQLMALTTSEEGVKADARKDGNTLCLVDPLTLGFMGKILLLRTRMLLEKSRRYGLVGERERRRRRREEGEEGEGEREEGEEREEREKSERERRERERERKRIKKKKKIIKKKKIKKKKR